MIDTTTSTPQIDTGKGEMLSQAPIMKEDVDPARDLCEEESSGGILEDDDEADPNADLEPNTDLDNDDVEDKGNDAGAKVGDIADEDVGEGEMRLPGYHHRAPVKQPTTGGGDSARKAQLEKDALKRAEEAKKAKEKEAEKKRKELALKKEKETRAADRGAHT